MKQGMYVVLFELLHSKRLSEDQVKSILEEIELLPRLYSYKNLLDSFYIGKLFHLTYGRTGNTFT